MSGPLLLALGALGVLTSSAMLLARHRARREPADGVRPAGRLAAVATGTRRWRAAGLGLGLVLGWLSAGAGGLGRGILLAAPLVGLGVLAGVVVGELRVPAPAGPTRSAGLEVRRITDHLPRVLSGCVATATVVLGGLMAVTTVLGSPDDLGRAGRALSRSCSPVSAETRGPWPGSFYTLPLAVLLLVGLVLAGLALHRVVRRPRPGEDPRVDDLLRSQAATAVVAGVGVLVTVPLAGIAAVASTGLLAICAPPTGWLLLGWGLAAVAPLAVVLGVWCGLVLITPATTPARRTAPAPR